MRRPFYHSCVGWPGDVDQLHTLDDESRSIKLERFEQLVDAEAFADLKRELGYAVGRHEEGLRIAQDYHVNYFIHPGTRIPFMIHSATHFVFATPEDITTLDQICAARREAEMEQESADEDCEEPGFELA